jgi:hypothetical protein
LIESAQLIIGAIHQNLETLLRFFGQLFGDSKTIPNPNSSKKEDAEETENKETT